MRLRNLADTASWNISQDSDNVTYVVEQTEPVKADAYHYKVVYRPETLVPDIDIKTSGKEG